MLMQKKKTLSFFRTFAFENKLSITKTYYFYETFIPNTTCSAYAVAAVWSTEAI